MVISNTSGSPQLPPGRARLLTVLGHSTRVLALSAVFSLVPASCSRNHVHIPMHCHPGTRPASPSHRALWRHTPTLKLTCLPVLFLLHTQAALAPWLHHAPPSSGHAFRDGQTCLLSASLFRSLSLPHYTPSHAHMQTSRHAPSLPFSALFADPQLHTVLRYCRRRGMHPGTPSTPSTCAHLFFFPCHAHILFHMVTLLFFFFTLPCLLTYLLTVTQTHLYIPTHTPPLLRVGVHIRKKPGNPADAGASAPSPASTIVGLARDQQLLQGYRAEEGGR